jgi:hypothetical protein
MKQTAVEWLIEQIIKYDLVPQGTNPDNVLFHQALEIEKQQIVKAYKDGVTCLPFDDKDVGEQYYNETYKKP